MESCLRNGAAVDMIQLARSLPGLGGQILYGSPSHRICSHMGRAETVLREALRISCYSIPAIIAAQQPL